MNRSLKVNPLGRGGFQTRPGCDILGALERHSIMTSPMTLLNAWNLKARKALGQNFLKEPATADRIVAQAEVGPDDDVLEIGAGLGILTTAVAAKVRRVWAVEKDRHLIPLLRTELQLRGLANVEILEQDALTVDLPGLAGAKALTVLGNLPYSISSQVVIKLIQERHAVRRAVLMFQKELAERLCARPGSRDYGRISVMLQYCADIMPLRIVKADQFHPRPQVDSAVLRIDFKPLIVPLAEDEKMLTRVVQAAFGQRRKTLRNALTAGGLPLDGEGVLQALQLCGIDPIRRAETLSVPEFVALSNQITRASAGISL
jgi:16S rRNA (adenine1518-N6/adenine1519-N6)-dimethyltransferase